LIDSIVLSMAQCDVSLRFGVLACSSCSAFPIRGISGMYGFVQDIAGRLESALEMIHITTSRGKHLSYGLHQLRLCPCNDLLCIPSENRSTRCDRKTGTAIILGAPAELGT
jgi:hypothetical protein